MHTELRTLFLLLATSVATGTTTACMSSSSSCDGFVASSKTLSLTPAQACAMALEVSASGATGSSVTSYGSTCQQVCDFGSCAIPSDYVRQVAAANSGGAADGGAPTCPAPPTNFAVQCNSLCEGRFTESAPLPPVAVEGSLAEYFAQCAHFEWVSVSSFERLARELALHGAPQHLINRARAFCADEVRHTEQMEALVRATGGEVAARPSVGTLPVRPLLDVAIENAVEGCVREAFGALLAHVRALRAHHTEVREVMAQIADDETRHAALGFEVRTWAETQLAPSDQRLVQKAMHEAIDELASWEALPAAVATSLGDPVGMERADLIAILRARLWPMSLAA